jgi:hypothetical protein
MQGTLIKVLAVMVLLGGGVGEAKTELGIEGSRFTVNGREVFLYGISYYGGLGAPEEFIQKDLDDMQRLGINWIRVWVTWGGFGGDGALRQAQDGAAVDSEGAAREPYFSKLKGLVAECDGRGMVVDVTMHRDKSKADAPRIESMKTHRRAVETVAGALKEYRNWYLDLANERNIGDARYVSYDELKELRELVRRLDGKRLVTASQGGDIGKDELRKYIERVGVDFICPHRGRDSGSAGQTKGRTQEYLSWMKELGRVVPVHYQEPFRRGYTRGWEPKGEDFVTDVRGAKAGGAAGWCLHNGDQRDVPENRPRRSFDMRDKRLFDQLDAEEMKALRELSGPAVSRFN